MSVTDNKMKRLVVGLKGPKDSGKSTVAKYITDNYFWKEEYFSRPLKEIICIMTGWSMDFVNGITPEYKAQRETLVHPDYGMTCRQLLQFVGTNLFREKINPKMWVNIMKRRIADSSDHIVLSDCRFPEECELVKELGGIIICLERDTGHADTHVSEQSFNTEGEYVIYNNESLDDLFQQVENILFEYGKHDLYMY